MLRRSCLLLSAARGIALAALLAGCTTETIPGFDAAALPDGALGDAGRDSGFVRRDGGPPRDAGPRLDDVIIYAHSRDRLFHFSPYTNTVTEVGEFRRSDGSPVPDMLDLAVDSAGEVYTSSADSLWSVDVETATVTEVGTFDLPSGEELFALSFLDPSESPGSTEILIGATNEGTYYEVDSSDASTTHLGQYPDGWSSSGDIVSIEGLGTFATLRRSDFPDADVLARILFSSDGSSVVTVIGPTDNGTEGFRSIYGLGYWGRDVYGFTTDGRLIRIDRATGDSELVSTETGTGQFWGAGVTTQAPFLI